MIITYYIRPGLIYILDRTIWRDKVIYPLCENILNSYKNIIYD